CLVAVGKLDIVSDSAAEAGRRYIVAPHLHAETAITLDDVYELMDTLAPSDAMARVLDARDYFEEQRTTTLKGAAEALADESPIDLVGRMLMQRFEELRADVEILRNTELSEREIEARVDAEFRELNLIAYRYLGLSQAAIDVATPEVVKLGKARLLRDEDVRRQNLRLRM